MAPSVAVLRRLASRQALFEEFPPADTGFSSAAAVQVAFPGRSVDLMPLIVVDEVGTVLFIVVIGAVVVLVTVVIAVVVLYQAEIDRHLAHRAGHLESSVMPVVQPRSRRVPRVGHYLTKACRPPSNAVPTRTCVAPLPIASSRSALMPAEIITACGCADRTATASSLSLPNASAAGAPSGETAITPPSASPSWPATASARAG